MIEISGLPLAELKQRTSVKWRQFPSDVLPLPVAEMDFEIADPIKARLHSMIDRSDTGYLGPAPELFDSFCAFAAQRWNWLIGSDKVVTATDVGVGMVEMARTVVVPGDKIMVNSPVYHNFYNWIIELKCELVDAPMVREGLHYTLDFSAIEQGYKSGVKIHFLCNPHNPVGTIFTREELAQLADLAERYGVAVFSDEIHAPLVYAEHSFVPWLDVSEAARKVGITVTSASKSWNLAGLKCALIIVDHEIWQAKVKSLPESVHFRASLFGALAGASAFQCVEWLDSTLKTLDQNRFFLRDLLEAEIPEIGYRIPDCSYLAWLDCSDLHLKAEPMTHFLEQGRVAFNAGGTFGPTAKNFVRLNFATSPEILTEAVRRMKSSL